MRTAHGSGLDNSCESRNAKLVEEECIDVQLLSELKFQANDLAVPLDELALLAIETCARDYAQKFFSGDGKVVLQTTKCSRWCVGPNGLQPQTSRGVASRYAQNNEGIEAACKKLKINKILCTTKKYSAILSDLTT